MGIAIDSSWMFFTELMGLQIAGGQRPPAIICPSLKLCRFSDLPKLLPACSAGNKSVDGSAEDGKMNGDFILASLISSDKGHPYDPAMVVHCCWGRGCGTHLGNTGSTAQSSRQQTTRAPLCPGSRGISSASGVAGGRFSYDRVRKRPAAGADLG